MFDDDIEIDDKLEVDIGKSLWKIDGPIGRFRFFVIQLGVILAAFSVLFVKSSVIPYIQYCPIDSLYFLLCVTVIIVWINYIAIAKRFYDMTGSMVKGIILSVITFLATLLFRPLVLIITILLIFIPGKMIKSNY